jgi:hypothetical protein
MSRTFKLIRDSDVSGVSGTGVICEGVLFSDGHAAIHWLGEMPLTTPYPQLEWVIKIHGHEGLTRLVWDDEQGEADFNEHDVAYLHEILCDTELPIWHLGARRLLKKVRTAMKLQASDSPVRV